MSCSRSRRHLCAHFMPGWVWLLTLWFLTPADAAQHVIDDHLHHLRSGTTREWDNFPEQAEGASLEKTFTMEPETTALTLQLRQQDVKQRWQVRLNDVELGTLRIDENDMLIYFDVPEGALRAGPNRLQILAEGGNAASDDIRVGHIVLDSRPLREVLGEAQIELELRDQISGSLLPGRFTIVDQDDVLQTVGASSNETLAVRPGIIYTADGRAKFSVPAGEYIVYGGRGFEYSLATVAITATSSAIARHTLSIRREVPTDGYVACDTHVHTVTYSGHGDATLTERMITLAGEGIELPIATDHNVHVDYEETARNMGLRQYFTPVIGNEVTTAVGHFNVFPIQPGARVPDYRLTDWQDLFEEIYGTPGVKIAILNHARDLHRGTRPFGPKLHNTAVGENLEGWKLQASGMEVINSAATQSDQLQLAHDWMTLLNRGTYLTPVGSSDSHDVGRHFVGQGRTYIRVPDADPSAINVDGAVDSFIQGQVLVSYGLLAELRVGGKYQAGELVRAPAETIDVRARVLGPHWTQATSIRLYANGLPVREQAIDVDQAADGEGVQWSGGWQLPRPPHDVHLVVVAVGPGIDRPYWKTAKPYQPMSSSWRSQVMAVSGAVWIDVDGDGRRTSAREYARRLFDGSQEASLSMLLEQLSGYDQAVAAQAAYLYHQAGNSLLGDDVQRALADAAEPTRQGFHAFLNAWRASEMARAGQ